IKQEFASPYSLHQNGGMGREWRVLLDVVRCFLADKTLPKKLWSEALSTAVNLKNRSPSTFLNGRTPYYVWNGVAVNLPNLRQFGTEAFVHTEVYISKLESLAWTGRLVGYDGSISY
ncbi:unnamed protein product, partial [Choristocarpus tenellus]